MEKMMKAAVLYAPADLRIEDVNIPQLSTADEVLINVKAAGICGSDIDRIMHTGTYSFPTIPGHEFCGVVARTGENAGDFKEGDRVVVAPILPCDKCESCVQGNYGQCDNYSYLGSRTDGGMAEYVVAPKRNLVRMPDNMSFDEGASVEPAAVTLHGMRQIRVNAGDSVAVLGCGTIGLFAIQFAKIMGATRIIAADIDETKLKFASKFGASHCIDAGKTDTVEAIKKITGGKGVDIAIETAGSNITQEQSIRVTKKKGRVLLLGTAHKDVILPPATFELIIRYELTIIGAWNSYSAPFPGIEWQAVMDYVESGRLDIMSCITNRISLEELPETIVAMDKRSFFFNKVIINMDQ